MNPNSFNTTGTETNEPNEWDALAAPDTGKEGELPGDDNDGWSAIDHPTEETNTDAEKEVLETGSENEFDYTGNEMAVEPGTFADSDTGDETMTGMETEGYTPSTGVETA